MDPLADLEGSVLEIGVSERYGSYPKGVDVEVYEPSNRKRRAVREATEASAANVSFIDEIPEKKYDAVVVSYVYEILSKKNASELSMIIGSRLRIDGRVIVFEHLSSGFFARLLGRFKGTSIEDTQHGLREERTETVGSERIRVYRRAVR